MTQAFDVAVLGATGAVGRTIIDILEERDFPIGTLHLLASERSAGETITFKGESLRVQNVDTFDWTQVQIGLFSAGAQTSAHWAPIAAEAGVVVIDNTSQFRYDFDVPWWCRKLIQPRLVIFVTAILLQIPIAQRFRCWSH